MVGSAYSLNCTISGVDRLTDAIIIYLWWKDGNAMFNQTAYIMSLSSLTISDAGQYMCQTTITSSFISAPITIQSAHLLDMTLTCTSNNTWLGGVKLCGSIPQFTLFT